MLLSSAPYQSAPDRILLEAQRQRCTGQQIKDHTQGNPNPKLMMQQIPGCCASSCQHCMEPSCCRRTYLASSGCSVGNSEHCFSDGVCSLYCIVGFKASAPKGLGVRAGTSRRASSKQGLGPQQEREAVRRWADGAVARWRRDGGGPEPGKKGRKLRGVSREEHWLNWTRNSCRSMPEPRCSCWKPGQLRDRLQNHY